MAGGAEENMMRKAFNLVLTGVGGQGITTLASVIADAADKRQVNIRVAEVRGMSQRGGSVVVHIRMGNVYSPIIPVGAADAIVSLELIEAVRSLSYAHEKTIIVTGTKVIPPPLPGIKIPNVEELRRILNKTSLRTLYVDVEKIAYETTGELLTSNMVMLGFILGLGILDDYIGIDDVRSVVSFLRQREANLKALEAGYKYGRKCRGVTPSHGECAES